MDIAEAERLARAIRVMHLDWIQVKMVEFNAETDKYEVKCQYNKQGQHGLLHRENVWTTLRIKNPRQWIDLLTQHGNGLERP